jgi:hypothetical protein
MITVDVEAQPERAVSDPVARLIWGRFPGAPVGGIDALMSIADRHGVKLVMFFDFAERGFYGDSVLDAAREIHRRGHDLQLHAHSRFLPADRLAQRGLAPFKRTDEVGPEQADFLVEYLCEQHAEVADGRPLAFRGGGYRYNANLLRALVARGVRLNSSYNPGRPGQVLSRGPARQFLWEDTGCLEVPISCVRGSGRPIEFNFNLGRFCNAAGTGRMLDFLEYFYREQGSDALAVLVMHSWSLSHRDTNRYVSPPLAAYIERFDAFIGALTGKVNIVTTADVIELLDEGKLALDAPRSVNKLDGTPEVQLSR